MVGGTKFNFTQKSAPVSLAQLSKNTKRITGLYSDDTEPTFSWWDETNRRDSIRQVGDNKMLWSALTQVREDPEPVPIAVAEKLHGLEDGEDMGMGSITVMGTTVDLHQTKAEKKALHHNRHH